MGTQAFSQVKSKGELNLTFNKGTSAIIRTQLEGAGSYDGEGFYGFGLSYLKPLSGRLDLEAGVGYSKYNVNVTPSLYPGGDVSTQKGNVSLLSVPVTIRANFLKYLFINAGIVVDFENKSSILDDQLGIGVMTGIGFKYNLNPSFSVFVNPYLQQHAIITFNPENYQQRLLDAGVKLGIGFGL